jgi:NADH dehydrogenase
MKKIVIIGAGYAGILTAKKLAKRFRKDNDVSVTVIDKNPFHTMLTELHEVAAGRVEEDSIRISYRKVFAGRKVNFIQDFAESIDFKNKRITGKNGVYEYDYLVMSAGSKPTYFSIPGAEENSFPLWSYEDAVRLRERILNCFRQASLETDEQEKRRLLSFIVVGAGFTGAEMAGELAEYVPILCDKYELDRKLVSISIADFLPRVVTTLPEKLSAKIQKRLEKMGVQVLLNTRVTEIGENHICLDSGDESEGKNSCQAGTVIWVAGIESAQITMKAGETVPCQRRGRLNADQYLRCPEYNDMYIAGDNLFYIPPGETEPVPQMVEN